MDLIPYFPTNDGWIDNWILTTIQYLLSNGIESSVLASIFGDRALSDLAEKAESLDHSADPYGPFEYPAEEIRPYTSRLTRELTFTFLLKHINNAGSRSSWLDLREFVERPELTKDVILHLRELAEHRYDNITEMSEDEVYKQIMTYPSVDVIVEIQWLRGMI